MKGMHGIIFSYDKENGLRELIENRVHGSIPFGGDYRIIDFILSSMVNAGVTDVGVIMHGKCQSMLDHLGTGKSWDLSRKTGGLKLLPAFAYNEKRGAGGQYRGKVEALAGVMNYLKAIRQDYVLLSDSDLVINLPLEDVLRLAQWGKFSVLGHLTLPLRYINENLGEELTFDGHFDQCREIFRALIESGCGIECNVNRGNTPLPDAKWLRLYHELGGEIVTIGTDAHTPEFVGMRARETQELLKSCGLNYVCTFEKKKPVFHKI